MPSRFRRRWKSRGDASLLVMRLKSQVTFPVMGAILGVGAPVGAFLIRLLVIAEVRLHPLADLRANALFYLYELIATSLVFGVAGFIAGRYVDRLRRGEAFYQHLAEHDSLTGLHNDRAFLDRYRRALERAVTIEQPLTVILIDVDKLKEINDAFGHAGGSRALMLVADAVRYSKRAADIGARWGGDEFAILLEGGELTAGLRVAEGIVKYLESMPLQFEQTNVMVTVTIGICYESRPTLGSNLFSTADRALFAGKAHGRNTIEVVDLSKARS